MRTPKQLLVNCATLLCLEQREGVNTSPSNDRIREVLDLIPIPESTLDHDHGRQTFLELRNLVIALNNKTKDTFPTEMEVLQQAQVACREENYLYEALMTPLYATYETQKDLVKTIQSIRNGLEEYVRDQKIYQIVKKYADQMMFRREEIHDIREAVTEMGAVLEPLVASRGHTDHPSMTANMDFSDPEKMAGYLREVKENISTDGALRTGWKGFNKFLGHVGAFKRGEFILNAGLQHNFKSQLLLLLFAQIALFNTPVLRDKTRKPLLYFISLENEIQDNLLILYKYIVENETGQPVVDADIDPDEASAYVAKRLRESGFEVKMTRFDPTEFSCAAFLSHLDGLYAEGYEIIGLFVDYLNMMSKSGIEAGAHGDDIRMLFRRVRNYTSPRGIAFFTPHQLSSDATQLSRENVEDFVKIVAGKNYYDGCRRLGQEPDLEIIHHIVTENGKKYLTIQRGKHRNVNQTPMEDQYLVLPFEPVGTIPWDIDKEHEVTLKVPGGGAMGSGEETPWWAA